MSSPGAREPIAPEARHSRRKKASRESHRSRKGCPECRKRKIKCDEKQPECTQCVKARRSCRIIDGLFRHSSLSFPIVSSSRADQGTETKHSSDAPSPSPPPPNVTPPDLWAQASGASPLNELPNPAVTQTGDTSSRIPSNIPCTSSPSSVSRPAFMTPELHHDGPHTYSHENPQASNRAQFASHSPGNLTVVSVNSGHTATFSKSQAGESRQDQFEIAFFLRQFAQGVGQWMDVFTNQPSYFTKHILSLANRSPLIRYSACAIAAKQLGQMQNPANRTRKSRGMDRVATNLTSADLDFLWYGAKYYEKAILLLARQISHEDCSACGLSPGEIYQTGNDSSGGNDHPDEELDSHLPLLQVIAACLLCQYEDLSATMRAWSGHLDGILKLIRPCLDMSIPPEASFHIPQPARALDASFWFFATNDILNSLTLRQPTRIDSQYLPLWRAMGVPLDEAGDLVTDHILDGCQEEVFSKALLRILGSLVSHDISNGHEWANVDAQFISWYNALPPPFLASISQSLPSSSQTQNPPDLTDSDIWFENDICAISMAFYHMARILLLVQQPRDALNKAPTQTSPLDLLSTYNALQRDLHHHAMEIVRISGGLTESNFHKYMIQPLYIAGRCLMTDNERRHVHGLLRQIEDELGLFTEYRRNDLSNEWSIPFDHFEGQLLE
ncbi:hypothetical protein N7456_006480 [Penicillium angulare]|uniref:Zn(2)-C6 fungal-type domain-containing protein n=1 Tax=Penicillium angulare TaxID=116970 RepID=A0A9W9FHY8_9EURO|nr:hypothetical protein N7456_006480 [Penicillium angulare]